MWKKHQLDQAQSGNQHQVLFNSLTTFAFDVTFETQQEPSMERSLPKQNGAVVLTKVQQHTVNQMLQ